MKGYFAMRLCPVSLGLLLAKVRRAADQSDPPIELTDMLSIRAGDTDTYHLPLAVETGINIDVRSDSPLDLCISRYTSNHTSSAIPCLQFPAVERASFVFVAHSSGDYLLSFRNVGTAESNALLRIASLVLHGSQTPRTTLARAGHPIDRQVSLRSRLMALLG